MWSALVVCSGPAGGGGWVSLLVSHVVEHRDPPILVDDRDVFESYAVGENDTSDDDSDDLDLPPKKTPQNVVDLK